MQQLNCWNDLKLFGIVVLTGEACGLSYRVLCDVTDQGKAVIQKCLSVPSIQFAEPWNRGSEEQPHTGSIMLTQQMLVPIGVFALLESGCLEVWQVGKSLVGIEANDSQDEIDMMREFYKKELGRTYAYRGDAGDRNIHRMSGRKS